MVRVQLSGTKETMLATLWGRALDSRSPRPVLGDTAADEAIGRLDYDFGKLMKPSMALSVALRAKSIDTMARDALAARPGATVLHLGCGLDTRVFRLDPSPETRWFDVDFPEIVELRHQLWPELDERPGYRVIASSVTDRAWLDEVPAEQPVVVIAEGLTMYLREAEVRELFGRITERFPGGEFVFDLFSRLGIKAQKINSVVRKSGSTLYWGLDDSRELSDYGLELVEERMAAQFASEEDLGRVGTVPRLQLKALRWFPAVNRMGRIVRCRF
ncbi:class I SAM-dependent methyltransferase [Amycolatopsis albispora]|uniref:Methyltransferase n=1 Tax=Amycolatopsis albispora TaxID=1804986 RepID=A0A344LCQ8_9PSEU|nr:class I SAM-dependent methyltransferase [Amycolatopsis albispora]AXB45832.1 methyltransferase [Amycolatopsis albispora]